jgi:BirA family biotin operon repressor/biotin-[acetyl-CoA-carboxylase] ligase
VTTSPGNPEEINTWPNRLEAAARNTRFSCVRVLAECDSTQDLAREIGIGAAVTTGRQVAGRGRPGRSWVDGEGAGVAVSVVVEARSAPTLSTASVLAVLDAVDQIAGKQSVVGAKFPNDVVHPDGRKLAGVLVEGDAKQSVIGIGVNVHAIDQQPELGAVSMEELGLSTTRIDVLELLLQALENRLDARDVELSADFTARHLLLGKHVKIAFDGETIEGELISADPFGVFEIDGPGGLRRITAAHAQLQGWSACQE